MGYRSRQPVALEKGASPRRRRLGTEDSHQNRSIERGVDCQPLLDVGITSEANLGLVSLRQTGGQGTSGGLRQG